MALYRISKVYELEAISKSEALEKLLLMQEWKKDRLMLVGIKVQEIPWPQVKRLEDDIEF